MLTCRAAAGGGAGEGERDEVVAGVVSPEADEEGSATRLLAGERPLVCSAASCLSVRQSSRTRWFVMKSALRTIRKLAKAGDGRSNMMQQSPGYLDLIPPQDLGTI